MGEPRVIVTVKVRWSDGSRHTLTLDTPRGAWPLEELHEMARSAADSVALFADRTVGIDVAVMWPRPW
jgi:hypothetical protein